MLETSGRETGYVGGTEELKPSSHNQTEALPSSAHYSHALALGGVIGWHPWRENAHRGSLRRVWGPTWKWFHHLCPHAIGHNLVGQSYAPLRSRWAEKTSIHCGRGG